MTNLSFPCLRSRVDLRNFKKPVLLSTQCQINVVAPHTQKRCQHWRSLLNMSHICWATVKIHSTAEWIVASAVPFRKGSKSWSLLKCLFHNILFLTMIVKGHYKHLCHWGQPAPVCQAALATRSIPNAGLSISHIVKCQKNSHVAKGIGG